MERQLQHCTLKQMAARCGWAAIWSMGGGVSINSNKILSFGSTKRQMISLYSTSYGIGVQHDTQYFRTNKNFAWYQGGSHNDGELNAGSGAVQMVIKDGKVGIGTSDPRTKLHITGGTDVGLGENSGYLIIGNAAGAHLAIDSNEIMAKSNGTTAGTLHLQTDGGDVSMGGDVSSMAMPRLAIR